jgi:hypothetical protein
VTDKPIVMRDADGKIRCRYCLSLPSDAETEAETEQAAAMCPPGYAYVWICPACTDKTPDAKS